ncbi:Uma2 family endonuclease [Iningainema tapete]|uniref:Uma2 family endonuclease n=1 Tax=Iningainema tapete BLCC-T55 TaxID=2748662 RepID=A0A8J6XN51_9CYAN|nr:Uma2 family endonuclease [Iningainema tapete]MBD2778103.1 Uma2 family endonuclease [Iningainema tapete BLCC-T55]
MTTTLPKLVTYEEFIAWLPIDGKRYELHDGVIVEMSQPTGKHEKVTSFLTLELALQIRSLGVPYLLPKTALVKPLEKDSGYFPDILLINSENLPNEPLWEKESTVTQGASIPLVIEVVSTNWRDDYYKKFADYEEMGIPEYWITDYAALGGRDFIGNPKQPALFVCELVDGEYVRTLFRGNTPIVSPTFPHLNLSAQQIFAAAS